MKSRKNESIEQGVAPYGAQGAPRVNADVGRVKQMTQIIRLVLVTAIAAWLTWWLGKNIIEGIKNGAIRHTDSIKLCKRETNPLGFWGLIILFSGFVITIIRVWAMALADTINNMK